MYRLRSLPSISERGAIEAHTFKWRARPEMVAERLQLERGAGGEVGMSESEPCAWTLARSQPSSGAKSPRLTASRISGSARPVASSMAAGT